MDHVTFQYENEFIFKWKWNNSMWLPLKTSEWVLGNNMVAMGAVQWWTVLPGKPMSSHCWARVFRLNNTCCGVPERSLAFGGGRTIGSPLGDPSTCSIFDPHLVHRAMPVIFKFMVPKGHESGRGESLLDAYSADKPANCVDCQSEEWKERSEEGNFVFNLFYLFHRKAHEVTHSPSIHS